MYLVTTDCLNMCMGFVCFLSMPISKVVFAFDKILHELNFSVSSLKLLINVKECILGYV